MQRIKKVDYVDRLGEPLQLVPVSPNDGNVRSLHKYLQLRHDEVAPAPSISQEYYEIIKKIGHGKYSEEYQGIKTANSERIVIKILQTLKGGLNIINLIDVVRDPMTKVPALIIEYVDTGDVDFSTLYKSFTGFDIR
jgi:serine/threonine protein kinase